MKTAIFDVFIFSSIWTQFVVFAVIVFPLAVFVLFRDLSESQKCMNEPYIFYT